MQDISCLQEHGNISSIFKSFVIYLLFARISQAVYFSQESCKMTLSCKKNARHLFFCKIFARYLLFATILQHFFHFQVCRNLSLFCKNLASFLIIARSLQNICYSQKQRKVSNFFKIFDLCLWFVTILQDMYCLQESFKTFFFRKNLSRNPILIYARISQVVCFLQESCKMTLVCKKNARYPSFARMSQDIYYLQ